MSARSRQHCRKVLAAVCAAVFATASGALPPAQAASAGAPPGMNLTSTSANVAATTQVLHNSSSATITVGNNAITVHTGSLLTPAEMVAVQQVVATGHQSLIISSNGAAVGGSLNLSPFGSQFSSLIIPSHVTTLDPSTHPLVITNGLSTAGSLIGTAGSSRFSISAADILVAQGGSISTLGTAGLNLLMSSTGNITNFGSISSSGTLSLTAIGNIWNGAGSTISSANTASLVSGSGQFTNAGLISATNGNINFSTITPTDLVLNNTGGQISALLGNINVRAAKFIGGNATTLTGGSFNAKAINLYGGSGAVDASVDQFNGILNVHGDSSHIFSNGSLNLGVIDLTGDPTFISYGTLNLTQNLLSPGADLSLVAAGNITASPGVNLIDASSKTGNGHNLNIVAGFNFIPAALPPYPAPLPSGDTITLTTISSGGSINLPGVTLKSGSGAANGQGGTITLAAAQGLGLFTGNITTGNIDTSAKQGTAGNITTLSAAETQIGSPGKSGSVAINATGGVGGTVNILGDQPGWNAVAPSFNDQGTMSGTFDKSTSAAGSTSTINGAILTSGTNSGGHLGMHADGFIHVTGPVNSSGPVLGANISFQSANSTVTLDSGVSSNSTNTSGQIFIEGSGRVRVAGPISATGSSGNFITIFSDNSSISLLSSVSAGATKSTGTGGSITMFGFTGVEVAKAVSSASVGDAGPINITSNAGDIRLGFNAVDNGAPGTTPLLISHNGGVNASSSLGKGGDITLNTPFTGNIDVAQDVNSSGKTTGGAVSIVSNQLVRVDGKVTANGVTSGGGSIIIKAFSHALDDEFTGVETGAISSTGPSGGAILVDSDNGALIISGPITTTANGHAGTAGSVTLRSLYSTTVLGAINANGITGADGNMIDVYAGKSFVSNLLGAGILNIAGAVTAGSTTGSGASVSLQGQTGVNIGGNLITSGEVASGSVTGNSHDGFFAVKGNVVTAGLNSTSGTAAAGGDVNLNKAATGSGVGITGNIEASGGSSSGPGAGNGGAAGTVMILSVPGGGAPSGFLNIGSIDARGGSTTNTAGFGGVGGAVTVAGSIIRLTSSAALGASINATGGTNGKKVQANGGVIVIASNGVQPFPTNFDTATTKQLEVALPGGMFVLGNATVNGSAGKLLSNDSAGTQVLMKQSVIGAPITAGTVILVNATHASDSILEAANPKSVYVTIGFGPNAKRTMINPSEAMYLYTEDRGSPGPELGINGVLVPVPTTIVSVLNPADLHPFKTFNLTGGPGQFFSPTLFLNIPDTTPTALIQLTNSTAPLVNGVIDMIGTVTAQHGVIMQLGKLPLTIGSSGLIEQLASVRFTVQSAGLLTINSASPIEGFSTISIGSPKGISLQSTVTGQYNANTAVLSVGIGSHYTGNLTVTGNPNTVVGGNLSMFAGNVNFGANVPGGLATPMIGASVNIQAYGNASVFSSGGFPVDSYIYVLGSLSASGAQGINDGATSVIDVQKSITLTSTSLPNLRGTWTAGQNISITGQIGITDAGKAPTVVAETGSLTLIALNGPINLTGTGKFQSGGDLSILSIGNSAINLNDTMIAGTTMHIGSQPALAISYVGAADITGQLRSTGAMSIDVGGNGMFHLDTGGLMSSTQNIQIRLHAAATAQLDTIAIAQTGLSVLADLGTISTASNARLATESGPFKMTTGGTINIGSDTSISAGLPAPGTLGPGTIQKSAILKSGNIDLEGANGVTINNATNTFLRIRSYGGDLMIRSTIGSVSLGNQVAYAAYGGNLIILGKSGVTGGTGIAGGAEGNDFTALAAVNGKSSTGGGIDVEGGTTTSNIANVVSHRPQPFLTSANVVLPLVIIQPAVTMTQGEIILSSTGLTLNKTSDGVHSLNFPTLQTNPVVNIAGTATAPVVLDSVNIVSSTPVSAKSLATLVRSSWTQRSTLNPSTAYQTTAS